MKTYNVQAEFQGTYTAKRRSTALMVHHAAALYPTYHGIDDVRSVANYHSNTRRWPGLGYHVCLAQETQGGAIARYNCSDLSLQRAHIAHRNDQFLGVACLTNFNDRSLHPGGIPQEKWINALAETLRDLLEVYPDARITGHKDEAVRGWETSCPGDAWHLWKPDLLDRVHNMPPVDTTPDDGLTYPLPYFVGAQPIKKATFKAVLTDHRSPLAEFADPIYDWLVSLNISADIWLAQCAKESSFAKLGIGHQNANPLNRRARGDEPARDGFADYKGAFWLGALASMQHLKWYYGQAGLLTVESIVPKWAPKEDGNDPPAYIAFMRRTVKDIRKREQ